MTRIEIKCLNPNWAQYIKDIVPKIAENYTIEGDTIYIFAEKKMFRSESFVVWELGFKFLRYVENFMTQGIDYTWLSIQWEPKQ